MVEQSLLVSCSHGVPTEPRVREPTTYIYPFFFNLVDSTHNYMTHQSSKVIPTPTGGTRRTEYGAIVRVATKNKTRRSTPPSLAWDVGVDRYKNRQVSRAERCQ